MASTHQAAVLLRILMSAYPEKRLERATLEVYIDQLADIPAWLLDAAIQAHIRSSPWFPRVSELRAEAAQLANTAHFETLAPIPDLWRALAGGADASAPTAWPLVCQAQALEEAFYTRGALDPAAWRSLAEAFTAAGRPHRAAHTLKKLLFFSSISA